MPLGTQDRLTKRLERTSGPPGKSGKEKDLGLKRFEIPEVPYVVPGQAEEYTNPKVTPRNVNVSVSKSVEFRSADNKGKISRQNAVDESNSADYEMDKNWKFRTKDVNSEKQTSDWVGPSKSGSEWNDYAPHEDRFKHSQMPGITNVRGANTFEFPNTSDCDYTELKM